MEAPKKVPWRDWDEWLKAWKFLQEDKEKALEILDMWAIRMPLPVRVDATRSILKVCKELTGTCNIPEILSITTEVARLSLGMCIARIVNQLCDLNQDAKFAKSVSMASKGIGLPEFLVDLRHDATHGSLPQLYVLARGLDCLYIWLIDNYWKKQFENYITKEEKILGLIDKFEKRSRVSTDNYALAQFAEKTFNGDLAQFRGKIANFVAALRSRMKEEPWAILFLHLQSKIMKFSEAVIQSAFKLLKSNELSLGITKTLVEDVFSLANPIKLSITPWVKHLLILQNTELVAHDILKFLIENKGFSEDLTQIMTQISKVSKIENQENDSTQKIEALPDVPRWRRLQSWSSRILGANSILEN